MRTIIESIESEYRRYRALADGAIAQVRVDEFNATAGEDTNSIAVLMRHVGGNLASRFTDFLTSDGEKPWRQRDSEFDVAPISHERAREIWKKGWKILGQTLASLTDANLADTVTIRGKQLSVIDALHRSLAHTAYHVGQIVQLAHAFRGAEWQPL